VPPVPINGLPGIQCQICLKTKRLRSIRHVILGQEIDRQLFACELVSVTVEAPEVKFIDGEGGVNSGNGISGFANGAGGRSSRKGAAVN
jgi:hypothetical protein